MTNFDNSHPEVINCVFELNTAPAGGGMFNDSNASPGVVACSFVDNIATVASGGGIRNAGDASPSVVNCLFVGNHTAANGGGIVNTVNCNPVITNCTFAANTADLEGGALGTFNTSTVAIANCIVWDSSPAMGQVFTDGTSSSTVFYSNIQGGHKGKGNVDCRSAMFADDLGGDWRVTAGSPCIDAGDNDAVPMSLKSDLDGNERFVDDPSTADSGMGKAPIVDMGAFEYQGLTCPGDFNDDSTVDTIDLLQLLGAWGACEDCPEDLSGDQTVDTIDLLDLLGQWGVCS